MLNIFSIMISAELLKCWTFSKVVDR